MQLRNWRCRTSKRLKYNPLCPQVAIQHHPQPPLIDLGRDHDQRRARQGRYAELFELQICESHELDIWWRNWKWITFVMRFAGCVEGLKDTLSWPTSHGTGKIPTFRQSPWKMSSSFPPLDAPERWSCSWVSSGNTSSSGSKLMRIFPWWLELTTKCYEMFSSLSAS